MVLPMIYQVSHGFPMVFLWFSEGLAQPPVMIPGDHLLGLEPSLAERQRGFRAEHQLSVARLDTVRVVMVDA